MENFNNITVRDLYKFDQYFFKDLLQGETYPWEVLYEIGNYIMWLGPTLSKQDFTLHTGADGKENVWIANDVKIANDAHLYSPLIVDHGTKIRHGAFIRGKVIIRKNCVIGNSTEIKQGGYKHENRIFRKLLASEQQRERSD